MRREATRIGVRMSSKTQRHQGNGGVWWPRRDDLEPPDLRIDVLIPALNEEQSLPLVLEAIPREWVRRVVVVDNGSTDLTASVARQGGAEVIREDQRGYGAACLCGLRHLALDPPDVVVFLDADYSDFPEELPRVVEPIARGDAELVIGSRTIGSRKRGALLPQAVVGNKLATSRTSDRSGRSPGPRSNVSICVTKTSGGRSRCRSKQHERGSQPSKFL